MPITNPDYSNLDYEAMAKSIGLKAKHMPMLIGSFVEESSSILLNLEAALSSKSYSDIKAQAHSIKGSAGNLQFNELYEMAKEMEHSAGSEDSSFAYEEYFTAIQKAINSIKI